ncbi:Hsp20/alpha crystallin family protein [Flavitalea sp. BT771]|uniref:Hsp20/alpha crystallin family protein n=1 Tax=Flavitalea sp. BT771 TaxID=3063329 RepID=UPI0026E42179|nr:Hsp20/alpha crystallin family protein [Flavitalea sp. BT771]MDO6429490.1 Hsp20/alpha crystallin family protein [Flavitalea sp. BT771]MDV6218382.1 Hsp20/alpha crystallin family protein [Flavitalea sp. BT771]
MSLRTLAKRSESLPSVFNDIFRPWESLFDVSGGSSLLGKLATVNIPAANIVENKDHYEVSLAAPGMKKDDFNIDVEGNMLTISAEKEEKKEEKDERYSRQEFNYTSFSRSFTLPDWVNKEKIDASYENGLLKVYLPKTEEAKKQSSKHITVK